MAVAVRAQTGSPGKGCGKAAAWKTKNRFSTALGNPAKRRGIPTFPQPRRRSIDHEPDISCATKTGHFNLLTTVISHILSKLVDMISETSATLEEFVRREISERLMRAHGVVAV